MDKSKNFIPKDGIGGLKQNFSSDATSGFIVFLLALPLSLGIAKASEFPPIMGLITAIIGGVVVSFFQARNLPLKGLQQD
jgi:MFS superfamily sulfate permease-like transporter